MPFKITLLSDVRQFLKGTDDIGDALGDVAQSLDRLADSSESNAKEAADALEQKFTAAFNEVKTEAKSTGDSIGTSMHQGTRRAAEGTDGLKESARQNAVEVAASFDGSAQSIADGFQGLAAEAFIGFGPAGVAAGLAAAAGLGVVSGTLQQAEEDAKQAKEEVRAFRDELDQVGNDASKIDVGAEFKKWGEEAARVGDSAIPFLNEALTNYDLLIRTGRELGVSNHTLYMAWQGDATAVAEVQEAAKVKQAELTAEQRKFADQNSGQVSPAVWRQRSLIEAGTKALGYYTDKLGQAQSLNQSYAETIGKTTQETKQLTDAQKAAQQTADDWSEALTDNLQVSGDGLDQFTRGAGVSLKEWNKKLKESTKEGTLDVDAWAREVNRRAKENKLVLRFAADVEAKLSPEALTNFEKLPTDTQVEIAKAYKKGNKREIIQTLEAEAKVTKVTLADPDAKGVKPVEIAATVVGTGVPKDVQDAADAGQREANRDANKVELKFKIDRDELQRQVNRAAASITPPTITVKTQIKKDVP